MTDYQVPKPVTEQVTPQPEFSRPDRAPDVVLAADGKTILHRYAGQFAVYARNAEEARRKREHIRRRAMKYAKVADAANCPRGLLLPDHYREDGTCWCNDTEFQPSLRCEVVYDSLGRDTSAREHRALRDAVSGALVEGTVTWVKNSVGAPVAAVVPEGLVEFAYRHGYGR